jgi:cell division protein FtsQ
LLQQPWIQEVSLRRRWPAGVSVNITEQKPVAYWNDEGYISETGDVFKPASVNRELNLPKLNGPEGQHNNVWKFMNVLYKEMAVLDYEVKNLHLDDRRAWQLVIASNEETESESINDGINVRLGRFDTEKRMQRFVRILPALRAEMKDKGNEIKVIDMRYPNGFAVQMSEA